jgi:citrate lyase subunit beta/citryl-CoA lyase
MALAKRGAPLRTFLFTNPFDPREIRRQAASGADALILDLEDAGVPFPESARRECRRNVREFLEGLGEGDHPAMFARVRSVLSGYFLTDVQEILGPHLSGVMLPKVSGAGDIHGADAILSGLEVQAGLPVGSVSICPLLETAQSIRNAYEIASASQRVTYMGGMNSEFGDHFQALGYKWTPDSTETLYVLEKVLVDARAAGIRYPVSGMWMGSGSDIEGIRAFARRLRNMGYRGMFVGPNPDYVAVVNDVFTPDSEEIASWQELVELVGQAEATDRQPVKYGSTDDALGNVVHASIYESAKMALDWARELKLID